MLNTMRCLGVVALALSTALAGADQVSAASGVLHRLLGRRADAFHFRLVPAKDGYDRYLVSAHGGIVTVDASSGTALARGAYQYLRDACRCVATWDGDQLALPAQLPDFEQPEIVCPNHFRLYFNVCTFGYTTPFWDWKRWEREIDWMALHGINMPLSMTGQEKVWENVWSSYGVTDLQALAFMGGPAFLPWHWMGNQDGHAGPMPQDYIDRSADLQKRIINRERELGMTPIVPGFSGFVPKEFQDIYARANVLTSHGWVDFPPTHQLDARDPMFGAIQKRFIETYTKMYGASHYYLCDLYNEMTPTVSSDRKLEDLAETSKAITNSISSADPAGVWVMQGWLFRNQPKFWAAAEMHAFLDGVPHDRMLLLDLAGDQSEIWRQSEAFRQKQFVWCMLHGFGGATPLFGDLDYATKVPVASLNDVRGANRSGMGITMEGTEQNALQYELMCDTMWRRDAADPTTWVRSYIAERYGMAGPPIDNVADLIRETFYTKNEAGAGAPQYLNRPGEKAVTAPSADVEKYRAIVKAMLDLPTEVQARPLFRRDLVDVTKRFAAEAIQSRIAACVAAAKSGDQGALKPAKASFDQAMLDLDALLDTIPRYRLSSWISDARHSAGDGDLMEKNARLQVTVWGGHGLYDYAAKEWSGLVGSYYRLRWDRFFDALAAGNYNDDKFRRGSADWELAWCSETSLPKVQRVDAIAQARKLAAEF